jgi:diaminopimelate decarboxylase
MKPLGPIPSDYLIEESDLLIGGLTVDELVEEAGDTPLFVYDMAIVRRRIERLRDAMPDELSLHYAIKANPYPPLLKLMAIEMDGLDVASAGELEMAREAGMPGEHISFAGPGKRDSELETALASDVTINVESEAEVERIIQIARSNGKRPKMAVRVNPDFELRGSGMRMGGGAKPFGVDAVRVPALVRRIIAAKADWRGFHIYAGSQALDHEAIIEAQAATVALAARLAEQAGYVPPIVNLGGGFGIPYFAGDTEVNVEAVGSALEAVLAKRPTILRDTRFAIELGRWLVGEAGVYLTRIVDRKVSQGETFLITDGGLHHQLAASGNFGTVVRRNYPVAIASRLGEPAEEVVNVVGCLCTPLDRLADKAELPRAEVGDVVAVFVAGAYGRTASPERFLGHPPPYEILIDGDQDGAILT